MPAMENRRIVLHGQTRAKLRRVARRCKDADTRTRYRRAASRNSRGSSAAATVSRTLERWEVYGEAGLVDRREDNGQTKADNWYAQTVAWILQSTPRDFFHRRPTWTRLMRVDSA